MAACWCALPGRILPAPTDDDLVPVKLRRGGRMLGGSLSWDKPQPLAAFSRDGPVRRHDGAERRDGHPPGAGRAGRAACRPHLGDARRRHAAGHRAAPRQGPAGAVPRHRRHALVRPAAVRHLRRHAQAHRRARQFDRDRRQRRRRRSAAIGASHATRRCRRPACSTASAHSRRRRRPRARCPPISTAAPTPIIRPASTARRKAWSRSIRWRRATGRRRSIIAPLNARHRHLPARRAARPARPDFPRRAGAAGARRAGGDLALRRLRRHAAAPARGRRPCSSARSCCGGARAVRHRGRRAGRRASRRDRSRQPKTSP